MCALTHNCEHSARLLMALKPAEQMLYCPRFVERELLQVQRAILESFLLSHWQSGHLTTEQLVHWTRAALDCEGLFDTLDELMEEMREQHPDNPVLLRWTFLVQDLVALRRAPGDDGGATGDEGGATDEERE